MTDGPRYATLRDYLRVLKEQRWVILAAMIVAGALAAFISLREDPIYEATAAISFQDETRELALLGGSTSPRTNPAETPQARAQTITEPAVFKSVAERLDRADQQEPPSPAALSNAVSTSVNEESALVDVKASWGDADFAAALANEFARSAAARTNREARAQYAAAIDNVEERRDDLTEDIADQTERIALTDQLTRLQFLSANARPAIVVETADVPATPVSPRPVRNTALGVLLGLVIGIVAAFLRDVLDRRLRGSQDAQKELGYPLVGHVREEAMGKVIRMRNGSDERLQDDLEAIRILRQNLEFLAEGEPAPRSVLITSALPAEGKSTVAASLACAIAASGKRTLLVECDLRRPALAERLDLKPAPGLTDYLTERAGPREILQVVELPPGAVASPNGRGPDDAPESAASETGASATTIRPLTCITAGTPSNQPAELLGSARSHAFIREVSEAYEAVVIDTSPLLPVADTLELLPHVEGVLICVRSSQTTRDQAIAAKTALELYPKRPTGLVVTGLRKSDGSSYDYYSYGYAYRPTVRDESAD